MKTEKRSDASVFIRRIWQQSLSNHFNFVFTHPTNPCEMLISTSDESKEVGWGQKREMIGSFTFPTRKKGGLSPCNKEGVDNFPRSKGYIFRRQWGSQAPFYRSLETLHSFDFEQYFPFDFKTITWVKNFAIISFLGTHQYQNTSRWKKQDFQLITCLVRSTFGEIWQARLHGSNRIVRIRLSTGSDDVYVYDKQLMAKNTNVNTARVV